MVRPFAGPPQPAANRSVGAGPLQPTFTVPSMSGWTTQMYLYVPGLVKVTLNEPPNWIPVFANPVPSYDLRSAVGGGPSGGGPSGGGGTLNSAGDAAFSLRWTWSSAPRPMITRAS